MQSIKRYVYLHLQENNTLYAFITVLFLMGVIFGAIIVNSLSLEQKKDLYTYLSRFFLDASNGSFAKHSDMFSQSFSQYIQYIGVIWLLGLSVIGLPVILILLFLKGVVVGFTVGFLINQMGWYGFLLSFVSVMPQNILLIPAFLIIAAASVSFSLKMIRQLVVKRSQIPFFHQLTRYTALVTAVGAVVAAAAFLQAYLSPELMKHVVHWSIS